MNPNEEFERKKEILKRNRDRAIERLESAKRKYEKIKNDETIDKKESRLEIALHDVKSKEWALQLLEEKLEFIRPRSKQDIEYRQRQYDEYHKKIKSIAPDDLHLCFHGCPIFAAKHIIEDRELSSSADRLGMPTSYDVENQVSVTTKNTIEVTLTGYAGLNGDFELPAGCIFAILPKNEEEIESSEESMIIGNVSFKENPERLFAIITTPENIEMIRSWCERSGIDIGKVQDYESFLQILQDKDYSQTLADRSNGKLLEGAVQTTEGQTKTSDINIQASIIRENSNEKQKDVGKEKV